MSAATPVKPPGVFPPPPGVTPNFVNPVVRQDGIYPLIAIFTPLATISLALRLYTKARIIRVFGWEDVAATVGWMCCVSAMGLFIAGMRIGANVHTWNVRIDHFAVYEQESVAAQLLLLPGVALPKIAILLFYLRLNPSRKFQYSTWAILVITWVYLIAFLLAQIFACSPPSKWWKPLAPGKCIDRTPFYLGVPIANVVIDLLVLCLPIPMLIKLQVKARTKLILFAIFASASCTVVVSALRIWAIMAVLRGTDFIWDAAPSDSLAVVELNMTVLCACVMVLRPFCRRHLPFLLGSEKAGDRTPDASNPLRFDGPTGPKSISNYRTKVSGGSKESKRFGKRSMWPSLGSTMVKGDDDDLESLSTELKTVTPQARVKGTESHGGGHIEPPRLESWRLPEHTTSDETTGVARSDFSDSYPRLNEGDLEHGIVKTVSLDVR